VPLGLDLVIKSRGGGPNGVDISSSGQSSYKRSSIGEGGRRQGGGAEKKGYFGTVGQMGQKSESATEKAERVPSAIRVKTESRSKLERPLLAALGEGWKSGTKTLLVKSPRTLHATKRGEPGKGIKGS